MEADDGVVGAGVLHCDAAPSQDGHGLVYEDLTIKRANGESVRLCYFGNYVEWFRKGIKRSY